MIRRPPRSTLSSSSAASDVYKRQYFKWPKSYASGRDVCKGSVQERERPEDVPPAGSASEMLSVGPVVRKWLEDVIKPKGICPAQVASMLLCIAVMDLLLQVNTGCISPAMLADAIARHYAAHVVAYGYTLFVPKHHYACCLSHGSLHASSFWSHAGSTNESTRSPKGGPSRCAS